MSGAPIKSLDPNLLLEASRVMNAAGRDYVNATKLVSDWALKNQAKADPEIGRRSSATQRRCGCACPGITTVHWSCWPISIPRSVPTPMVVSTCFERWQTVRNTRRRRPDARNLKRKRRSRLIRLRLPRNAKSGLMRSLLSSAICRNTFAMTSRLPSRETRQRKRTTRVTGSVDRQMMVARSRTICGTSSTRTRNFANWSSCQRSLPRVAHPPLHARRATMNSRKFPPANCAERSDSGSYIFLPIVQPPSTVSTAPVMKPFASSARNRMARAISSGSAQRPSAWMSRIACAYSGSWK